MSMSYQVWKLADRVTQTIRSARGDDSGASLVEYALLVALIAVVCVVAVTLLGSNASTKFSSVASAIS
jgi:pilus assembly protein Flp/PilA